MVKIATYNVAGLRSMLKKPEFYEFLKQDIDILCLQETKANEDEIVLNDMILTMYPYRYYNSTKCTTQRKGLSGTAIWCKNKPDLKTYFIDEEGRITCIEFNDWYILSVYVPNSQLIDSLRYNYRINWNNKFIEYINLLRVSGKPVIICGDMNVANEPIDIVNPNKKQNKIAGYFDIERILFKKLLTDCDMIDTFRYFNNDLRASTYWSNFLKSERTNENGWRIDYIIVNNSFINNIKNVTILDNVKGSDHCPVLIEI